MNSSYSSESSSSLLTESTSSNAISSCCDHAIEEIDEDSWNSHKSCQSSSQMLRPSSMIESSRKCKTMFTRTTGTSDVKPFGQTFPNCGTYFFKHISDGEEDDGELVGKVQELEPDANCNNVMVIPSIPSDTFEEDEINQNQITSYNNSTKEIDSLSPRSDEPASIEQLVMDVEELVILRRPSKVHRFPSYLNCDALNKTVKSNESDDHDNVYDDEGMDCRRDDPRRSMHSSSSLSILMDCLINQPESIEHGYGPVTSTDNESEDEAKRQTKKVMLVKRRRHVLNDDVDESSCLTDEDFHLSEEDHEEDEELSEYWDQEKYLSEHNYDEPIDEDSTLKLLNFGDDYSKFIDSMSEGDLSDHRHPSLTVGLGPVQSASTPNTKQRLKRRLRRSTTVREVVYDSVSESELDDAWRVALHSRTKLNEVKQRFKNIQDEEDLLDVNLVAANREELTSLKDLCFENVECILKLLEENPQNSNTIILKKTKRSFKGLLRHWQEILHMIVKRLQLSENLSRLILDIQTLETSLSDVSKMDYLTTSNQMVIHNKQDLEKDIQELKSSIVDLTKLKSDLFTVNLEIHNFLADFYSSGRKDPHRIPSLVKRDLSPSASLKEKVVTLYAMWDNTFHKVSSQLVSAESTLSKLIEFEVEKERLVRLKEESINNATNIKRQYFRKKNSLSLTEDSGISESGDNDSEETILIKLRRLAQDLETKLTPDSHLIKEIAESLKNSSHNVSSTIFEEPKPKPFSESHKKKNHKRRKSNKSRKCCDDTTSTWSYFWRVICASLPFHLILMAAVFMAWSYHPKCCEASNGMLLLPQLRYINGPPPI